MHGPQLLLTPSATNPLGQGRYNVRQKKSQTRHIHRGRLFASTLMPLNQPRDSFTLKQSLELCSSRFNYYSHYTMPIRLSRTP